MVPPPIERADVQGIVLFGYRRQPVMRAMCVRFDEPGTMPPWLSSVAPEVRTAGEEHRRVPTSVNLALSVHGLRSLGVPEEVIETFPPELVSGMHGRAKFLGDVGDNDPRGWDFGGPDRPLDALLLLYAEDDDALASLVADHRARLERAAATVVDEVETRVLPDGKEHFGFLDGIAQPRIEGVAAREGPLDDGTPPTSPIAPIRAGELLLGYENEYGAPSHCATVPAPLDPSGLLSEATHVGGGRRNLGLNGSYLVCRKMQQWVGRFWRYLQEQGEALGEEPEALAAKLVGRHLNGAPLAVPDAPRAGSYPVARFDYADDPHGFRCPLGAHVRRANPRASKGDDRVLALRIARTHRLVRRGRPFGPPALDPLRGDADDQLRGLFFLALNANLRRQFEFIQQTWLSNPKFEGLRDEDDPLVGARPHGPGPFTMPDEPVRRRLLGMPAFVRVRGGEYLFMPSVRALRWLASAGR
jgi:Dyp-type peroxidase family